MPRPSLLDRPDLSQAAAHFAAACAASRAHSRATDAALARYGAKGPLISGIARDHFPDVVKNRLRALARAVSHYSDAAYAARPPRVRSTTMHALARAVAARDGSGFYGPRP